MYLYILLLSSVVLLAPEHVSAEEEETKESHTLPPTLFVAVFVRNKAHTLPLFLALLAQQDYPKRRMSLYIRSDHNDDSSGEILRLWTDKVRGEYHSVDLRVSTLRSSTEEDESSPLRWTDARFRRLMELKEGGLSQARRSWADFVLFVDADVFLTRAKTLQEMVGVGTSVTVTAPMLKSLQNYANFWAGMDERNYYLRTDDYFPILERKRLGCFVVPMVHSCVFINLRRSDSTHLTFLPESVPAYDGPMDDIIVFALSARSGEVQVKVCNEEEYGYIMRPLDDEDAPLEKDAENLSHLKLQMIADVGPPPPVDSFLQPFLPKSRTKDSLGVDMVYMINLRRRPDRKRKMDACLDELGIDYQLVEAVDGKVLDESYLVAHGIRMLSNYSDRYHKRPMTYGEVGCFMSHYHVWTDVLEKGYERVIVLEDDIRFEPFFRENAAAILLELEELRLGWDLVYLGRKIMEKADEPWVEGSARLVRVDYAYWTLGYILGKSGARLLVDERPLEKMVPVDEYLPIMYDRHPNATWKEEFANRRLRAFSAAPRLLYPTHYTGESGYVSDTEGTAVIKLPGEVVVPGCQMGEGGSSQDRECVAKDEL